MTNKRTVKTETVIRTVTLIITMINQTFIMLGKNPLPFAEEDIYIFLSTAATIAATLWAWWKNNSFTENAIKADEHLNKLKKGNN